MIEVTRLKGKKITINAELIEAVEETPDTVITLTNGKKYVVGESVREITELVIDYKRKIHTVCSV
ncbi:MAG: flagellar FlbD family protein [Wujia sp.]